MAAASISLSPRVLVGTCGARDSRTGKVCQLPPHDTDTPHSAGRTRWRFTAPAEQTVFPEAIDQTCWARRRPVIDGGDVLGDSLLHAGWKTCENCGAKFRPPRDTRGASRRRCCFDCRPYVLRQEER